MPEEIKLTPASKIVEMTKALPEVPCGSYPLVYDQVVVASAKQDASYGKPDPAQSD